VTNKCHAAEAQLLEEATINAEDPDQLHQSFYPKKINLRKLLIHPSQASVEIDVMTTSLETTKSSGLLWTQEKEITKILTSKK
jgi:hypothetical protein